ncbi:MAG: methionyl-tRNA formyltransferase [Gammaproteobacteria bacterium]|jgi:methionyl-tRNA formyltransferase
MSQALNLIFAGTPEFAAVSLKALVDSPHRIAAVYTQPDRPAGRGRKLKPGPVKQLAMEHQLTVMQPDSLKDPQTQQQLAEFDADLMIVAAYGLLLPKAVLAIPRLGCVNVHASLLPRWRGAAPIQRAILAGDRETGITIMQMDEGLDTGDMLLKHTTPIENTDTAQTLHDRLAVMGAEALLQAVHLIVNGTMEREPQNDALATYAEKIQKAEARIDWRQSAYDIHRKVRAFNPWPVAQGVMAERTIRIWQAQVIPGQGEAAPGTVLAESRDGIDVMTGDGILRITRLQLPGGKPLAAADFVNAQSLKGGVFDS